MSRPLTVRITGRPSSRATTVALDYSKLTDEQRSLIELADAVHDLCDRLDALELVVFSKRSPKKKRSRTK